MILNTFLAFITEETGKGHEEGAGWILEHVSDHVVFKLPTVLGVDLSVTFHVLMIWIAAALLILIFGLGTRKVGLVSKGFGSVLESLVIFLRDDVLVPYLGDKWKRYAPYILTAFFFILTCNLLGLIPKGGTATSNINVTASMAVLTFLIGQGAGMRKKGFVGYWKSFIPPGIPGFVIPILFIAEVMGLFTKHFALAIRLFANMIADHLVVFTFLGLIFIFKNFFVAFLAVPAAAAIELLAVLIAFIQAYIFTMLSAVFIGIALSEEH